MWYRIDPISNRLFKSGEITKKRLAATLSIGAILNAALVGVSIVFDTQQANAASGTRVGAWVLAGKYSYNPNMVCYAYPTMVWG